MKKTLLIFFFFPVIGFAQEKSFELGLLFGGSYNSLIGEAELTKKTLRPKGGFLAQYNLNNRFSIKSKLLYHIKGGKKTTIEPPDGLNKFDQDLDFHYVTIPLLAQWSFGKNKWRFFCNTGFYLGYLIKVENVFNPKTYTTLHQAELEKFNKIDFGLILGSGTSFQINERIKTFLELSFNHGLINTSIIENKEVVLTQAVVGGVGLTYSFPVQKKTFNGRGVLDCPDYEKPLEDNEKKKTKWRLVLYKDGKKVGGKPKKPKRGKSKLFKNKK